MTDAQLGLAALQHWPALAALPLRPLTGGLINTSFLVGDGPSAVLQRLHPVFGPEVHLDIEAITAHVAARGMETPRLIRTAAGALWHVDDQGGCWRVLTFVPGVTWHKLEHAPQAAAAGALVGRWHRVTADLEHEFHFSRPLAHDTAHHMQVLRAALDAHPEHRLRAPVGGLADGILGAWERWDGDLGAPTRIAHGDLKISNLRFSERGEGICLLDLDTMGQLSLDVELGDAWRSWCNPAAEDADDTRFSVELFEASVGPYLNEHPLTSSQLEGLPAGVLRICLELSARFAADALNERYFGWSPSVAPTRGDHNLLRAQGQFALARSVAVQRGQLDVILRR